MAKELTFKESSITKKDMDELMDYMKEDMHLRAMHQERIISGYPPRHAMPPDENSLHWFDSKPFKAKTEFMKSTMYRDSPNLPISGYFTPPYWEEEEFKEPLKFKIVKK